MDDQTEDQFWANHNPLLSEMYDDVPHKSQTADFDTFDQSSSFYLRNVYTDSQYAQSEFLKASADYSNPTAQTVRQQTSYNQLSSIPAPTTTPSNCDELGGSGNRMGVTVAELDEPSLLDELEIYPERILEKSLAVLIPFQSLGPPINSSEYILKETELAGPITFCLMLAACLSISDNKPQFGYIYGLSVISVVVMFCLIWLMCNSLETTVTISAVASVLGYSMLPIVGLSIVGVFVKLNNFSGTILAAAAIFLATIRSSSMFCLMTGDPHQRYLIAYPCALLYTLFSLLVLF